MTPRDKVVSSLVEIVGFDIAGSMADRHIRRYLAERGKPELTEKDMADSDFVPWFIKRLEHLSMIKPQAIQNLETKLKS